MIQETHEFRQQLLSTQNNNLLSRTSSSTKADHSYIEVRAHVSIHAIGGLDRRKKQSLLLVTNRSEIPEPNNVLRMSRLADTVEAPSEDLNAAPATPIYAPDDKTRTVAHDQQSLVSITSEALPIDHPSSIIELHMPDLLSIQKGKFNEEQECDKERGTMAETIDMNITSRSADENPRIGDALGIENERLTGQSEGIKAGVSLAGLVAQPAQLVKEETSPSLTPIREAPSPVSNSAMPSRGTFSKKAAPGGPRRPGTKKRKLESRADTPQSQRSGTPNSMLGGRSASRAKKQNSATPLYSSPAPDDNEDDDDESDDGLYCICRKGDDHTWMIACDGGCDDWFHGRCIGIDQRDGRLIDKFICK